VKWRLTLYRHSLYCTCGIGNFIPRISLSQLFYDGGGFIGLSYFYTFLLLLLFLAALTDLRTDRVPNGLIVIGIGSGISGSFLFHVNSWQPVVSMLLAFLLMYPLFKIGALGAGDVKVFLVVGSFFTVKGFLTVLASAFVIGALISLMKILTEHNGRERIAYFMSYISEVARTKQWKIYGEDMVRDISQYHRNKIHFTVPVLFSVALWIGGVI